MTGGWLMVADNREYNQKMMLGCGILVALSLYALAIAAVFAVKGNY